VSISPELAICGALVAIFIGFRWGWSRCETEYRHKEEMRASWEQIKATAIREGILDENGNVRDEA